MYNINQEDALEARRLMKTAGLDIKTYRRLEVIALRGEGKSNSEIVEITGFADKYVPQIISKFFHNGFESLLEDKRTGNNRRISPREERRFLNRWKNKALKGRIITAKEMWLAFQKEYGVEITMNAFYKLLNRNKWSKKQPRKIHKKAADAKTQRASKKLSPVPENSESAST